MKKIILLNWRWTNAEINKFNTDITIDNDKVIFLSKYSKMYQFNTYINEKLDSINGNKECIVLSHYSEENSSTINIAPNEIKKPKNFNGVFLINTFSDGRGMVYYSDQNQDGLLDLTKNTNELSPKETIVLKNFQKVWDYYRNQNTLENLLKKIIDLFLPLHRDIKGLNEVTDEKKTAYLNEVLAEYNESYCEACENEWKEIKDILAPNNGDEVLGKIFRLSQEEKNIITSFPTVNEKLFKDHQSTSNWYSQFIAIVDLLNKKIARR